MMINEDFEREHLKDRIFVDEEEYLFLQEMKYSDPNIDRLPAKVINISKNEHNPITLRGNNKEELQLGHDLHASTDKGED
jgi:hypothetical protein